MTENVTREPTEENTEANAEGEAANEQDKVKPTIYIGLVLTALFGLGKNDLSVDTQPIRLQYCKNQPIMAQYSMW